MRRFKEMVKIAQHVHLYQKFMESESATSLG